MDHSERLRVFLKVAELLSFTRASEHLGLPKASVSMAITGLEESLETRLFQRTTRKVRLTQDGQVLVERAERLLADFDELLTAFRKDDSRLRGRLRVDLPVGIARDVVVPRLPEFLAAHPELELELSSSDRRVDVIREGFDCVLRVGPVSDPSVVFRSIGQYEMRNCASVGYVRKYGLPRRLADLTKHRIVDYATTFGERSTGFEYEREGQLVEVPVRASLTVNAADSYLSACLAGLGIIQVPELAAQAHLAAGTLVEILPHHRPPPLPVSLVFPERRHLPDRVRVFMNWLEEIVRPRLKAKRS